MKHDTEISERAMNDSSLENHLLENCDESVNKELEDSEMISAIINATMKVGESNSKSMWVEGASYVMFFNSKVKLNKTFNSYNNEDGE